MEEQKEELREEEQEAELERPWVDIIKGNRLTSNGIETEYTAPMIIDGEIEVNINEHDIASNTVYWEHALIMYALEQELLMNVVKKFMVNTWNFVALPELYYNEERYFIIRFCSKGDRDAILMRGSYTIYRKPMFLHEWTPELSSKMNF